jgi:hypothetical protein
MSEIHTWVETNIESDDVPAAVDRAMIGLQAQHKRPIRMNLRWERHSVQQSLTLTATSTEMTVAEVILALSI